MRKAPPESVIVITVEALEEKIGEAGNGVEGSISRHRQSTRWHAIKLLEYDEEVDEQSSDGL